MSDAIFFSLSIFMMIFGMVTAIYCLLSRLMAPAKREKYYVLVGLRDDNDPSAVISYALEKRSILGECEYCKILAVDCGLSADNLRFLNNMYGCNHMFAIVSYAEAFDMIARDIKM